MNSLFSAFPDIITGSLVFASFMTIYMIYQNYWYHDIIDQNIIGMILFTVASFVAFFIISIIGATIMNIIYNNVVLYFIVRTWIVLWLIRCGYLASFHPIAPYDDSVVVWSLLGISIFIYGVTFYIF